MSEYKVTFGRYHIYIHEVGRVFEYRALELRASTKLPLDGTIYTYIIIRVELYDNKTINLQVEYHNLLRYVHITFYHTPLHVHDTYTYSGESIYLN